jgi:DNA-binding GntR family transcriptional regulator
MEHFVGLSDFFDLDSLREIFRDSSRTQVKVLEITLQQADPATAATLSLPSGARVILIRRLLLREKRPVIFHEGHIRCDPKRPVVEAELELGPLSDLFSPQGQRMVKKGKLELIPAALDAMEAAALERLQGATAFRIAYVFYDFGDVPVGCGHFTAPPEVIRLETRLGIWEDA